MTCKQAIAALALIAGAQVSGAQAATVYSQSFESGVAGSEWSGGGSVQETGGLSLFGFGQMHLRNDGAGASLLTLSGLAAHTELTVSFSLAMWDRFLTKKNPSRPWRLYRPSPRGVPSTLVGLSLPMVPLDLGEDLGDHSWGFRSICLVMRDLDQAS